MVSNSILSIMRVVTRRCKTNLGWSTRDISENIRWEHWRETERKTMLHLTEERRMNIGKAINDYFILRT